MATNAALLLDEPSTAVATVCCTELLQHALDFAVSRSLHRSSQRSGRRLVGEQISGEINRLVIRQSKIRHPAVWVTQGRLGQKVHQVLTCRPVAQICQRNPIRPMARGRLVRRQVAGRASQRNERTAPRFGVPRNSLFRRTILHIRQQIVGDERPFNESRSIWGEERRHAGTGAHLARIREPRK